MRRAQDVDEDAKASTESDAGSAARQLLGMKGASDDEDDIWKIRLQLTKPVTWVPLIWGTLLVHFASKEAHLMMT